MGFVLLTPRRPAGSFPLTDRDGLDRALARNAYQVGNSIRRQCQNDVVPSSEQGFIVGVTKA
jgi:hypothetical protein